jgi:hypothetical protein
MQIMRTRHRINGNAFTSLPLKHSVVSEENLISRVAVHPGGL